MLVVEADGFRRIDCPAARQLSTPATGGETVWVLPGGDKAPAAGAVPVCLEANWTRMTEAHNAWPPAMTEAFLLGLGKRIYASGTKVPSGRAQVLLVPAPRYSGKGVS